MDPFDVRPSPPPRRRYDGEISSLTWVFIPAPEVADPRYRRPDLPPWPDEVEPARAKAAQWAACFFEAAEVKAWLDAWPNAKPAVAAGFRDAGITPDVAMTKLAYGKVRPNAAPLATKVAIGDLSIDDAVRQIREAGL